MSAPPDAETLARASAEAMWAQDRASQDLGMTIEHVGSGTARLAMAVTERMANGHGLCHGGYIFTLADSAFACNSHGDKAVAQSCTVTYLDPARVGERLVAEAVERSRRGRTGLYDVTVRAEIEGVSPRVVAEFRGQSRTIPGRHVEA